MEWFALSSVGIACALLLIIEPSRSAISRRLLFAVLVVVGGTALSAVLFNHFKTEDALKATDAERPGDARTRPEGKEFAGSVTCRSCHPAEYDSWHKSFHRRMTQPATPETIVPDLVEEHFRWQGRSYRMWREGDQFFADTPRFGSTGHAKEDRVVAPVVMTTGSHHMQAYWTPVPDDVTPQHEAGRKVFNARCAVCHGDEGRGGTTGPMLLGLRLLDSEISPWIEHGPWGHQPPPSELLGAIALVPFTAEDLNSVPDDGGANDDSTGKDLDRTIEDTAKKDDASIATVAPQTDAPYTVVDTARPPKRKPRDPDALSDEEVAAVESFIKRIQFDGKLAQFPFVYLVEKKRWVHEEDSFLQPPVEIEAEERAGDRWGYNCDECHSTGPSYGFLTESLTARSDAVDLGIACESCHGPGRKHVEAQRDPLARYQDHLALGDATGDPARSHGILQPLRLPKDRASYVCAQCHADLERTGSGYLPYTPGGDLTQAAKITFVPQEGEDIPDWLQESLDDDPELLSGGFWDDGTVRIAGRDFNGLSRSACYTRGEMSCLSCHSMHKGKPDDQLRPLLEPTPAETSNDATAAVARNNVLTARHTGDASDRACTQCHAEYTTLEDRTAHTHHRDEGEGARCVNCHMPFTTYGLLKAIRAHRVDSPTVEMTTEFGRPNACNLCHLDRTLAFTDDALVKWYGKRPATLSKVDRTLATGPQWATREDAIVRAVTAWHMGWAPAREASARDDGGHWLDHYLALGLEDDYVAVRLISEHRLRDDVGGAFATLEVPYPALEDMRAGIRADAVKRAGPPSAAAQAAPELLLDANGIDEAAIAPHLDARDDTDVRINE